MYESVFSKYEMRAMGIKVTGDASYTSADCVGTVEEELNVLVVTKNCRGVAAKVKPRGAGSGTVTVSMHMPYAIYAKMFAMDRNDLIEGVQGYGRNNLHREYAIVATVYDEDDNKMLVAYPRCINQTGPNANIENGAEEVAEVEIEISLLPDSYGYCKYECVVADLPVSDTTTETNWMTDFTPSMVHSGGTTNTLTQTLTNVTSNITGNTVPNTTFTARYTPASGYDLPTTITVTVGGTTKTVGTDYVWNDDTGVLVVPSVTGALVVTVTATETPGA